MEYDPTCEFCLEFSGGESLFRQVYGPELDSRVVHESEHVMVVPTVGQLFAGSMLVLPREHHETLAGLPEGVRAEILAVSSEIEARLAQHGSVFAFEHGSTAEAGGSCGIHHAHLHLVPLPRAVAVEELVPLQGNSYPSLASALAALGGVSEYLLCREASGRTVVFERGERSLPSQFMRRRLAEHFELGRPWDWRTYTRPEPALEWSVGVFGAAGAARGQ